MDGRVNVILWNLLRVTRPTAYIPDGTEKVARRASFPGCPVYDVVGWGSDGSAKLHSLQTRPENDKI